MSYSSVTPNYGLRLWSGNGDQYSTADLIFNFTTIDTVLAQPRTANSIQLLSALPVTSLFQGELVYLTAANGGFASDTVVRYNGSSWAAVGPGEILGSVPVTGNYGGRLVMLSAASGGFGAWTLITYNGATNSWQSVGLGVNVVNPLSTPLGTLLGNYAGRVIVITNATTEPTTGQPFNAYDCLCYNGSVWNRIGPQVYPTETATIAGLGTGNAGESGLIRAGASPFTFAQVNYSSTYNRWVSTTDTLCAQLESLTTEATAFTNLPSDVMAAPYVVWGVLNTAGMKPQYRLIAELTTDTVSGTVTVAMAFRSVMTGATPGGWTTSATALTVTGTTNTLEDTGWIDIPSLTIGDFLETTVQIMSSSSSVNASIAHATIRQRWVSI